MIIDDTLLIATSTAYQLLTQGFISGFGNGSGMIMGIGVIWYCLLWTLEFFRYRFIDSS